MGMKVNAQKTQLLCTSTAMNYQVWSFIWTGGIKITSGETLKTVGYTFGRRPGPHEHIKELRRKFAARTGDRTAFKKTQTGRDNTCTSIRQFPKASVGICAVCVPHHPDGWTGRIAGKATKNNTQSHLRIRYLVREMLRKVRAHPPWPKKRRVTA